MNGLDRKTSGFTEFAFSTKLIGFLCLSLFISANLFAQTTSDDAYRLGPGDILDVIVVRNEILSRNGVRIDNDGLIQMPMLEENIPAACLTERELADLVREKYRKYLVKPSVYINVKEVNSQSVALIGAVNSPGRFQLRRQVRLLELITFVNGPSSRAGRTIQIISSHESRVCRDKVLVPNEIKNDDVAFLSLNDTLQGTESANPFVKKGDVIRIVEADQAYIIGNVKNAIAVNLNKTVTLSQALAEAGGVLPNSNIEKIKILRQENQNNRKEIIVNLKNINKKSETDIILLPNDIVEVPGESGGKKLLKDVIRTITGGLAALPVRLIF